MPLLRTDDGPRRLRAVWLGPRGSRLYWDWTYVQWAVFLALLVVLVGFFGVTAYLVTRDPWLTAGVALWGAPPAFYISRFVIEHADYDRPLRWWRRIIPAEWKLSRRTPREAAVRVAAPKVLPLSREIASDLFLPRNLRPRPLGRAGLSGVEDR